MQSIQGTGGEEGAHIMEAWEQSALLCQSTKAGQVGR